MLVLAALLAIAAPTADPSSQVRALQSEGQALLQDGRYADALTRYDSALDVLRSLGGRRADEAALLFLTGYCFEKLGELDQALDRYERAAERGPPRELNERLFERMKEVRAARGVTSTKVAAAPPGELDTTGPWIATAGALALFAGSGVALAMAHMHRGSADEEYEQFVALALSGAPTEAARLKVEDSDDAAVLSQNVSYGLVGAGGAAAIVAIVLWGPAEPAPVEVAVGPDRAFVTWRW